MILLWPKAKHIGDDLNVRKMYETSKTRQVIKEMQHYSFDILCLSECHWSGSGKTTTNRGNIIIHAEHIGRHIWCSNNNMQRNSKKSLLQWQINQWWISNSNI